MEKHIQIMKTALLVEDDLISQRVLEAQLNRLRYQVTATNNVTTALKLLNEDHYSLILTDLRLPDKPGDEVIKATRLSDLNQDTVLIVCSAQISRSDVRTYLDLGANAVLIKPLLGHVLEETIKKFY